MKYSSGAGGVYPAGAISFSCTASIVAGYLETEGIAVVLLDEHIVRNNQLQAQMTGDVELLVKQQDLEAVLSVLNDIRQGAYCPEKEHEYAREDNVSKNSRMWTVLSIALIILLYCHS
ncbi:TPA: hypothetical protein ACIBOM_004922 [Salmonella enterica subsp. enterica serovar Reading]|uniref:hypothetical protein n=1 Tax=Salmonella enterica TaxID=28901 RepID=UPI0009AC0A13|nr:hypothetical protein [Salmonella enterica]EBZ1027917.1 hypothetical protein [Salmonella enterica subsp. enterica serovar Muenchen]ECI3889548.1 hypothetical protein [Salmonella enterica subsp. enterica serovar Gombe]EIM5533496.1 hypothetical protein [Salmonella enterica subsp. enterica]ELP2193437.1 DUF2007 domain-containing protein [Salmonella enterica subsp. enterica serovar Champaign]EBB6196107.1 DUF2007 domain-containing protein [Salmonella enterica]